MANKDMFGASFIGFILIFGFLNLLYIMIYDLVFYFLRPIAESVGVVGHTNDMMTIYFQFGVPLWILFACILWYLKQSIRETPGAMG